MGRLKGRGLGSRLRSQPSRLGAAIDPSLTHDQRRAAEQHWRAWYGTARWKRLAVKIKKRDGWTCQQTGELLIGKYPAPNSAAVDHKIPHHGNPDLFWDESNLQTVSKKYHDKDKQLQEKRGQY